MDKTGTYASSIIQRRTFCNLRDGAQVPGYQGFIPQAKYRISDTYGTTTHKIAQEVPFFRNPATAPNVEECEKVHGPELPVGHGNFARPLVPGYTGYIPRLNFRYGSTYGRDGTNSIREFVGRTNEYDIKQKTLNEYILTQPPMIQSSTDEYFQERINALRDEYSAQTSYLRSKRPITEPHIPGYTGFVPFLKSTEVGLAGRFHKVNDDALKKFWYPRRGYAKIPDSAFVTEPRRVKCGRIYLQQGMIPLYTGYLPQNNFHHGHTYGDLTRRLPVCSHNECSYGAFVNKTRPLPTTC